MGGCILVAGAVIIIGVVGLGIVAAIKAIQEFKITF